MADSILIARRAESPIPASGRDGSAPLLRRAGRTPSRRRPGRPLLQRVEDDWDAVVAVSSAELDCLEAHFTRFLDGLLESGGR